jgi:flavodoxin
MLYMVELYKNVVIYYSHGGHTAIIAHKIAEILKCEEISIEVPKSRQGFFGFIRLIKDGIKKRSPPILLPEKNWAAYQNVIIGTPTWGGTYAAPIHALLTQHSKDFVNYAVFSTSLGDGIQYVATHMTEVFNKPPIAMLNIQKSGLKKPGWEQKLDEFLKSMV